MATNVTENKIHVGENVRIFAPLIDSNGDPVPYLNLLTIDGIAYDELGNQFTLEFSADTITPDPNAAMYIVETATMRESKIKSRIDMTFNSPSFPTSFARDIIVQDLFPLAE